MDYKNLYKYKYIYRIYETGDNLNRQIHMEQYPIIYMNDIFVYFKESRKQQLSYKSIHSLCFIKEHENNLRKYNRWYDKYVLCTYDDLIILKDIKEDLLMQMKINISKDKEKEVYLRYEKAKKEFEEALTAIEVIEKLKINIKEKKDGNS